MAAPPDPAPEFDLQTAERAVDQEEEVSAEIDDTIPTRGFHTLPVVGLGGSAGGLAALQRFFKSAGEKTGAAYVVILHLAPEHESSAAEILQRSTRMPVIQVTTRVHVELDHVYVIPPGKHLSMNDGELILSDLTQARGRRVTVDIFFRTLADTHGPHATAVVLSGADSDGSIGLKRIKERGGLTVAQDPTEAEQDGMPRAAIATRMVDWVLKVEDMPARLATFRANENRVKLPPEEPPATPPAQPNAQVDDETALREALTFLRIRSGHDFSYYKRATILRRIRRRMQVNDTETLPLYLNYLRTHPGEAGALLQDLVISVTNFFRDKDCFRALEEQIPAFFKDKGPADRVRVWVPACATGEEAYSIAMLMLEYAGTLEAPPKIQIFATDIDAGSIAAAREAVYPETIAADVSEERLRRFFSKDHRGHRVRREVRDLVLFALHDLLKDAPFSRLDLVSCRNLLIYLNRDAQTRAFEIFHFALRPEAKLFLSSSESADEASALFSPDSKKHRIYTRRSGHRVTIPVPVGSPMSPGTFEYALQTHAPAHESSVDVEGGARSVIKEQYSEALKMPWSEVHFRLIERLGPPSLLVDAEQQIIHYSQSVSRFLQIAGEPTSNLLRVVHPMLRVELRAALFQAQQTGAPVDIRGVAVEFDGVRRSVDVGVRPAQDLAPGCFLVVFRERGEPDAGELPPGESLAITGPAEVLQHLEAELEHTKRQLRENVEQNEAQTEEMKASNEELQAMNEELRSASEELETGREELQSINEELTTVNQELKSNVDELSRSNSDLQNLMASTNIATIFLDRQLCIQRFTPPALTLFNFIASDIGRPLSDLTHRLAYAEISADAERVIEQLTVTEREVQHADGRWFLTRMLPYRTEEDNIAGVVLTFVDITRRREAEAGQRESEQRGRALIANLPGGAAFILDQDLRYVLADGEALRLLGLKSGDLVGRTIFEALEPELIQTFEKLLRNCLAGQPFTHEHKHLDRWFLTRGAPVRESTGEITSVLMVSYDIHQRKEAEEALKSSEERLRLMIENAHDYAIFTTDLDRKVTSWNPGAARLLGFTEGEVLGKPADIIFTAEDRATGAPERELDTARKTGRANDERWHERADGTRFYAIGAMMAMRDAAGEIVGYVKILRDQTESRRAQEALEESRSELWEALQENEKARAAVESANRAKDHFLAVLSHELRTPLTPVLMATHVLERRSDLPGAAREALGMIQKNIEIEVQLIDDLLDVTRIGRGKLEIIREPVDLHEVVRQAVSVTDGDVQAKELRLTVSLNAAHYMITGDFRRLQQVIWNLLKNAAKFTPNRGTISLTTRDDGDRAIISIADDGIGIEAAILPMIFESFAQGGAEITRAYGGLGLGLAISKAVVEAHGGRISAESAGQGQGSTFMVELPLEPLPEVSGQASPEGGGQTGPPQGRPAI